MTRISLGMIALFVALGFTDPAAAGEADDQQVRFLIASLRRPIPEIDRGEVPLVFLLDTLAAIINGDDEEKKPEYKVKLIIDMDSFNRETMDMFDPEKRLIKFHTKLVNVRLETILDMVCDQIDGAALVRGEFIAIVPRAAALRELNIPTVENQLFPHLVHHFIVKTPLEKALQQLAERNNANIVLAPGLEARAETLITARLVNVPIDAAVETLAEMAGLKVTRRANVYLVTAKEGS